MRKEKSRDAARSRRSKENHEFYELAKLLPLPAAITSQLDFLDKASIIRLTISFLKLRQFSVNGHPPWAPDFTTLGSVNPYSTQALANCAGEQFGACLGVASSAPTPESAPPPKCQPPTDLSSSARSTPSTNAFHQQQLANTAASGYTALLTQQHQHQHPLAPEPHNNQMIEKQILKNGASLFDIHQGTHILQSLDGFAFAIGRDGRFLYISETVSMYLGLSQVEMTGSSVFDYTHQQDHEELAQQLGIAYERPRQSLAGGQLPAGATCCDSPPPPGSVLSQYSAASCETSIDEHLAGGRAPARKRAKITRNGSSSFASQRLALAKKGQKIKSESLALDDEQPQECEATSNKPEATPNGISGSPADSASASRSCAGVEGDPFVRQFCIRMKSTLTKRGCQHFKSSGYRVVHVVAHLRAYQSNDHGHLMDPLDDPAAVNCNSAAGPLDERVQIKSEDAANSASQSSKAAKKRLRAAQNCGPKSGKAKSSDGQKALLEGAKTSSPRPKIIGMVAVAIALPPPSINELRLESDTFVLRLGLDLRISHIEPKITELLNYPVEQLAGQSLYSLVHPADIQQVRECHRELLAKGQMMSGYYRLLARPGGYIWIQTCATLICNSTANSASASSLTPQPPLSRGQSHSPAVAGSQAYNSFSSPGGPQPHFQPHQFAASAISALSSSQAHYQGAAPAAPEPALSVMQQHQLMVSEQEQCVIFVNHMITNVIETETILDVCQSQEFVSNTNNTNNSNSNNNHNNNANFSPPDPPVHLQKSYATHPQVAGQPLAINLADQTRQSPSPVGGLSQQTADGPSAAMSTTASARRSSSKWSAASVQRRTAVSAAKAARHQHHHHHRHHHSHNHNHNNSSGSNNNIQQQQQVYGEDSTAPVGYHEQHLDIGTPASAYEHQQHPHYAAAADGATSLQHHYGAAAAAATLLDSPVAAAVAAAASATSDQYAAAGSIYKAAAFAAAGLAATDIAAAAATTTTTGTYGAYPAAAYAQQQHPHEQDHVHQQQPQQQLQTSHAHHQSQYSQHAASQTYSHYPHYHAHQSYHAHYPHHAHYAAHHQQQAAAAAAAASHAAGYGSGGGGAAVTSPAYYASYYATSKRD